MTHDQLKDSIANVRELMQTALAAKERDLLGDVLTGIVNGSEPVGSTDINEQLDAQAVAFEADHPKLARALREVIDSLSKMGV